MIFRDGGNHLDATSLALVAAIARLGMRPTRRHLDRAQDDEARRRRREGKGRESRGMVSPSFVTFFWAFAVLLVYLREDEDDQLISPALPELLPSESPSESIPRRGILSPF